MDDTTGEDTTDDTSGRSRRIFMHSAGLVGLGLTAGATVVASQQDDDDAGTGDGTESTTGTGTDTSGDGAGGGGRTPIDSSTTIEEPGEYELVADIRPDASESRPGITVDLGEAGDGAVSIYGNGHTIDLSRVDGGTCIEINPRGWGEDGDGPGWYVDAVDDLTVRGGNWGISAVKYTSGRFAGVTAVENGGGFNFQRSGGTVTNCVLAENGVGASLSGSEIHGGSDVDFEHCTIRANDRAGVAVSLGDASIVSSRVVENGSGLSVGGHDARGSLGDCHICGNEEYGVDAFSGTDEETGEGDIRGETTATDNYWGAPNGPSSYGDPEEPYTDPETGRPADGDGDAIPEGLDDGVSNVRFDPFRESPIAGVGADR